MHTQRCRPAHSRLRLCSMIVYSNNNNKKYNIILLIINFVVHTYYSCINDYDNNKINNIEVLRWCGEKKISATIVLQPLTSVVTRMFIDMFIGFIAKPMDSND